MSSRTNLIGDPIPDLAINQLNARAGLLAQKGFQDDAASLFKVSSHNAYVKLSSFVSITDKTLANALGVGTGTELAKKWALFNGDTSANGGNGSYQNVNVGGGVGKDTGILHGYGQGGFEELGIRPMPGIVGLEIIPAGMAGSVRQATLKLKCHNLRQLDILDVLYFRFGFSMLIEWGHTTYIDNNRNLQQTPAPIDVFAPGLTKEGILQELAKRRNSTFGNYDGMLGLVTNYEWAAAVDGGYECTLKLSGIGGVIESLKINTNSNWPGGGTSYTQGQGPLQSSTNLTGLASVNASLGIPQVPSFYQSTLSNILVRLKENILGGGLNFEAVAKDLMSAGLNLGNQPGTVNGWSKGFNAGYMSGLHPLVPDINFKKIYTQHRASLSGPATSAATAGSTDQAYIPLGLFIAIVNNSCTAYDRTTASSPLVYIDFNPDTNYCFRVPDQVSLDPRICLIDSRDPAGAQYQQWLNHRGVKLPSLNPPAGETESSGIMADLHTAIRGAVVPSFVDPKVETRGYLMRILVNIDHLLGLVTSISDKDQTSSVSLSTMLTGLMNDIAKVTGNVNEFKVIYDDESNVVRILDQQLVHNELLTGRTYPTIQTFGLSTGVRNMTFKTEANTAIGSMLAIEAMAAERTPSTDGRDGSAFSVLNSRLEDRLVKIRQREANATSITAPDTLTEKGSRFTQFRNSLYLNGILDPEGIADNINFYSECMNAYKSQKGSSLTGGTPIIEPDHVTARGILPLSINLTMNGISTIRIFEGFVIPTERLPAQYKNGKGETRVGFVVQKLNQTVQGQNWLTVIQGQMVNIPSQKTTPPAQIPAGSAKTPSGGGGGTIKPKTKLNIRFDSGQFSTANDNNPFDLVANGATQNFRGVTSYKIIIDPYDGKQVPLLVFDTIGNGTRAGFINFSGYFTRHHKKNISEITEFVLSGGDPKVIAAYKGHYVDEMRKELGDKTLTMFTRLTFRGQAETDPNNIKMFKALCRALMKWEGAFKKNKAQKMALIDNFTPSQLK